MQATKARLQVTERCVGMGDVFALLMPELQIWPQKAEKSMPIVRVAATVAVMSWLPV